VKPSYPAQIEREANQESVSLAERLDPAIGEATSVMGAMLTELLRRTLRGGVVKIGDELHTFVAEKVDATIADRTPAIEQAAAEVAEHTARSAATEVAHEEVSALETRTRESDDRLATRIEETDRQLATRIEETAASAHQRTEEAARQLAGQIEEAEKRVRESADARLNEQVQLLVQRSREGSDRLKARFTALEVSLADLGTRQQLLRDDLSRLLGESEARLRGEVIALTRANEALAARIVELEKPRGLRALFLRIGAWLRRVFGRKAAKEPAPVPDADEQEEVPLTPRP
jgi:chromosome segregation ATPase